MKIKEIKLKLNKLENDFSNDTRILELQKKILKEREDEINKLKTLLEESQNKPKTKKERWPEDTPKDILKVCEEYWRGTSVFYKYRIHCWNDRAVWTSYPSGGYSTNGGWHKSPPHYYLLDLKHKESCLGHQVPKVLNELSFEHGSGKKVTQSMMEDILNKLK